MKTNWEQKVCANFFIFCIIIQLTTFAQKVIVNSVDPPEIIFGEHGKNLTIKAEFYNVTDNNDIAIRWEPEYANAKIENRIIFNNETKGETVIAYLTIINANRDKDQEFFVCYLNEAGTISKTFTVKIVDEVHLNQKLWLDQSRHIPIYGRFGESIKFVTKGFNEKYSFSWFKYIKESPRPIYLQDPEKYILKSNDDTFNLIITNLMSQDTGNYSTFYLENNPWNIFDLEVLDKVQLDMNKTYYFQNISKVQKEIACLVYGRLNETIKFHICNNDGCLPNVPVSDSEININEGLYKKGVVNYTIIYPYNTNGKVKCSTNNNQFLETEVTIGSFPTEFSVIAEIKPESVVGPKTNVERLKNGTFVAKIGQEIHLECAVIATQFANNITWLNESGHILGLKNDERYSVTNYTRDEENTKFYVTTLEIRNVREESSENYTCKVYSLIEGADQTKIINILFKKPKRPLATWIIIKISLLILLLLFILFEIGKKMLARRRKNKLESIGLNQLSDAAYPLFDFIKYLPYDKTFEFPEKRLRLGKCLGYGNFGKVHQGLAKKILPGEEKTIVAVKTVKDIKNCEALGCLISEMKIMIHLGKHLNVVNLLGAITKNINRGELMVIVEYCPYGNLEMFLRKHRTKFINQIDPITDAIDSKITKDLLTGGNTPGRLSNVPSTYGYIPSNTALIPITSNSKSNDSENSYLSTSKLDEDKTLNSTDMYEILTTTDLICWAYQITRGMDFISKRNIMHGDLAARNILLADDNIVKICDFGLAKTMSDQYGNYIKKQGGQLPVKWLAIESLQDNEFSIKSDVWSFGILLWELFSLGCSPYPGISARGFDFVLMLKNGYRMEKPEYSNQELYDVMLKCWQNSPARRPKFSELENILAEFLESDIYTHYVHMNEPYVQANTVYFKNQAEKRNEYLTILNAPQEPRYLNDVSGYIKSVRTLENTPKPNEYVATPSTERLQFDFRDSENGSPRYENNFNSLKRNKKKH